MAHRVASPVIPRAQPRGSGLVLCDAQRDRREDYFPGRARPILARLLFAGLRRPRRHPPRDELHPTRRLAGSGSGGRCNCAAQNSVVKPRGSCIPSDPSPVISRERLGEGSAIQATFCATSDQRKAASRASEGVEYLDSEKDPGSLGYARDDTKKRTSRKNHFTPGKLSVKPPSTIIVCAVR